MTKLFGIDISTYQAPSAINYDQLAGNISFAILRAGFTGWGTGDSHYKDDAFETHYRELSKRGVPLGAYWYSCANTPLEGIAEAKELLRLVKGKTFSYPLVMDVEDQHHQAPTSKQVLTDTVIAFCQTIEKAGYYAMIYSSTWWLHNELDLARLAPYDIWAAQWSVSEPAVRHGIWQYTSNGKVKGYSGRLDCNYAYKNYPKIIRENGLNGQKKPEASQPDEKPEPKPKPKSTPEKPKSDNLTYTVKAGDTLWGIAKQFLGDGSRYPEIKSLNGLTTDLILVGQVLKLPSESADFQVGNRVKITAKHYSTGELIPDWVKEQTHVISELGEDKVLLGWPDGICSWVPLEGIKKG